MRSVIMYFLNRKPNKQFFYTLLDIHDISAIAMSFIASVLSHVCIEMYKQLSLSNMWDILE